MSKLFLQLDLTSKNSTLPPYTYLNNAYPDRSSLTPWALSNRWFCASKRWYEMLLASSLR